ncbi:hypothetical protein B0T26DRAFT_692833, partial [Lasiosphaeria miniovina]
MTINVSRCLLDLGRAVLQGRFPKLKRVRWDTKHQVDDCSMRVAFRKACVDFAYDSWPFSGGANRHKDESLSSSAISTTPETTDGET